MSEQFLKLKPISYKDSPKVLLIGNGISRSFGTNKWGDLLGEMSCTDYSEEEQEAVNQMPFPLQAILMTGDNVDEGVELIANKLNDNTPVGDEQRMIITSLIDMGFDAILTTNYTYEIEKSIDKDFKCEIKRFNKYRKTIQEGNSGETQFGLFKCMQVTNDDAVHNIWHIHGELGRPKSMVLGHYYYGKLLVCIQQYISTFLRRYNGMRKRGIFLPESWVDYFMLGDVYIVGLGLDQSEMDLWWLINCKKRHARNLNSGKIYWFEPNMDEKSNFSKRMLAKVNDIEVISDKVRKTGYKDYYKRITQTIEKCIQI